MKNNIEDLRNHLFATIEALQDKDAPMDLDRAKTISEIAQTMINSAKVEVDMMRAIGSTKGSKFIALPEVIALPEEPNKPRLVKGAAMSGGGE